MATSPPHQLRNHVTSRVPATKETVSLLLRLQKSAQKINSILDLDELLEEVVREVCDIFGCLETAILLRDDGGDLIMRATSGCSLHSKGSRFSNGYGLVSHTAAVGEVLYTPDVTQDARYVKCEKDARSELDIPLKIGNRVTGVFSVAHPEVDGFSKQDRHLLESMAANVAVAIENATRFQRERLERERLRMEQEEARKIQESMLPKRSPEIPGFALEGVSKPSGAVGGDFFDYIPMSNGRVGLVLADVSGKGLPAALLMATTRGVMRSLTRQAATPAEILSQLNTILIEDFPAEKFVTMVFAVLDPRTGTVQIANAGHPWPIVAGNHTTRFLSSECGMPLGIMESAYCEMEVTLEPGSKLVLYSDGISERVNAADEEYGVERLCRLVQEHDASAADIIADADAFAGRMPQNDDSTVIVLRRF